MDSQIASDMERAYSSIEERALSVEFEEAARLALSTFFWTEYK